MGKIPTSVDKKGMRGLPSVVVVALLGLGLASCNQNGGAAGAGNPSMAVQGPNLEQSRFISATVTRRFDPSGQMLNDRIVVKDPQELAKLESFFREAGRGERGPASGGWVPSLVVTFKPKLGREVKIHSNYEVWSEGTGDWPATPAMKDYIARLFQHNATALAGQ